MVIGFNAEAFALAKKKREERTLPLVLAVEDEAFSLGLILSTLDKNECTRISAGDGVNALEKYSSEAPDIVMLDIELPDINGIEILEKILANDKDAFIIMTTSHSEENYVKKAMTLGAMGYITKPFSKQKVVEYIHMYQKFKYA